MITFKKWDIILVSFPFRDLTSTKKRPALVISPDDYNNSSDFVILFITSNLKAKPKTGDYRLQHWKQAGLPKPSMIRMKFATINKSIIVKKIGNLIDKDIQKVKDSLTDFFK